MYLERRFARERGPTDPLGDPAELRGDARLCHLHFMAGPRHSLKFYVGVHQPAHAGQLERSFISINRVRGRKKPVPSRDWVLDSGAFRELEQWFAYRHEPAEYAAEVNRLGLRNPGLRAAVSQDYMCEPYILERTGLTVEDHQRLTIERYDALLPLVGVYLMPVLQGYTKASYLAHIEQYGDRLGPGAWVGVGSICKRNTDDAEIQDVLTAIRRRRPDLRLHGFGLKITALGNGVVRDCLYSADSMAWSFRARKSGRDGNDPAEAVKFESRVKTMPFQHGWDWT